MMATLRQPYIEENANTLDSKYCDPLSYRNKSIVEVAEAIFGLTGHRGEDSICYGDSIEINFRNTEDFIIDGVSRVSSRRRNAGRHYRCTKNLCNKCKRGSIMNIQEIRKILRVDKRMALKVLRKFT